MLLTSASERPITAPGSRRGSWKPPSGVFTASSPGGSGLGLAIARGIVEPVRDGTLDKVRAFDLGADDYLIKPFDHLELLARLRALLRRTGRPPAGARIAVGDLSLDYAIREVRLRGEVVKLTSTEYRLLEELVQHTGTVLPHRHLLERVWGAGYVGDTHYLKVFVRRLRSKLGDDSEHPRYIQTEWGIGYRFLPSR